MSVYVETRIGTGALLEAELSRLRGGEGKGTPAELACIGDALSSAEGIYKKANAATSKNKAKNALLKDYYATWRTAMNGIQPQMGEIVLSYNRRQGDTSRALNEKGERLKLE